MNNRVLSKGSCSTCTLSILPFPPLVLSVGRVCVCAVSLSQVLSLAVGRGMLYSAGTDLTLRSWQLNTMEEVGATQVSLLTYCVSQASSQREQNGATL